MPEILSFISPTWIPALWSKLIEVRNRKENQIRDITDSFGDPMILARYYVEPKCQHHNPADYNEVEAISFVKCPIFTTLNDFFNRELLVSDGRNQMFVLGDAGMGKTSLLVMLKLTYLTSFWPQKYHCELLKLGPKTLTNIADIPDKRNTTLLLDALDEDPEGFGRVEERLLELLSATTSFRRVIISCRTQYFPAGGDDPFDRPGRIQVGGFVCPMIFLSLFDDEQVDEYLIKRFSKAEAEKLVKSKTVIEKMETLRFRPLLLAHIEDIIDSQKQSWNEYTIYKALVEAWLLREEKKCRRLDGGAVDAKSLWAACTTVALYLQSEDKRHITARELDNLIQSTPDVKHLRQFDVGGRSLLNRNSKGDYRFSHYTTQEFLIAHAIASRDTTAAEVRIRATDQIIRFLSTLKLPSLRIDHMDFTGCNLGPLKLAGAEATGAVFARMNLNGFNLTNANLSGADLSQAELDTTLLTGARLNNARLIGAALSRSILDKADLTGADLSATRIEACSFRNTTIKAKLDGAQLIGLPFQEMDFSGSSLRGCNFAGQDLSEVNFDNLDLQDADLTGCQLTNASFRAANLTKANLTKADLSNADLTNAILDDAIVNGANLRTAALTGVNLNRVNLKSSDISRQPLKALLESGVSLKDVDLSNYDLRFADLSNVDLSCTDLAGKDLYGASLYHANLSGADLRDASLENASLVGAYYSKETKFPDAFSGYEAGMILR